MIILPVELLVMKVAPQHHRLGQFTGLHIFVVSASVRSTPELLPGSPSPELEQSRFDMSIAPAERA